MTLVVEFFMITGLTRTFIWWIVLVHIIITLVVVLFMTLTREFFMNIGLVETFIQ